MVGVVKGCLFRSINFFSWNFQSQTWIFKVEMNACFACSGKKLTIIFCYRNGGLVSEQYNIWGKSGEDLIKVVFDITPVHPKTSTESSIQKQSQGTKPSAPEVKEPSLPDNPGHKPSSGPSPLVKISVMFSSFNAPWHLCQDGHGSSHFSTLQLSLHFHSLRVRQAAAATHPECPFHPLLLTPHSAAPLLCLKPAVPSSASFGLQWCLHQRQEGLVSVCQQGCCWGHLLLGSWEWKVQAPLLSAHSSSAHLCAGSVRQSTNLNKNKTPTPSLLPSPTFQIKRKAKSMTFTCSSKTKRREKEDPSSNNCLVLNVLNM